MTSRAQSFARNAGYYLSNTYSQYNSFRGSNPQVDLNFGNTNLFGSGSQYSLGSSYNLFNSSFNSSYSGLSNLPNAQATRASSDGYVSVLDRAAEDQFAQKCSIVAAGCAAAQQRYNDRQFANERRGLENVDPILEFVTGARLGRLTLTAGEFAYGSFFGRTAAESVSYRLGEPVTKIDSYIWATMSHEERIAEVVTKYGINLQGRSVIFDAKLGTGQLGMTSSANPRVLRVGAGVMNSEQELAATIAHELRHSRAYMGSGSNAEAAAEASENALRQYILGER